MADLSDLDTTQIGIIAFWNALDHRVVAGIGDVDPTDCIAIFDGYDVYDNGIEGYKALGSGRYFHARVKTDGWIVAWIDRTNTFAYPDGSFGEDGRKGYYDIIFDWRGLYSSNISSTQTTLSYLISLLYNALLNKTEFTYANTDVGHYSYEFTLANVLTLMDVLIVYPGGNTKIGKVQYATGTTLYYIAVAGYAYGSSGGRWGEVKFAGNTITTGMNKYGAADVLAEGWMPLPIIDYDLYVYACSLQYSAGHGSMLFLWA